MHAPIDPNPLLTGKHVTPGLEPYLPFDISSELAQPLRVA